MPSKKKSFRTPDSQACVYCGERENREMYGKLFHKGHVSVHENCLFFASGLSQRGKKESDGILGFLIPDIKQEVLRGKKLRCSYCKTPGATVGCCLSICRKTYHFQCGLQNLALYQFFGKFSSFCQGHKPVQKPKRIVKSEDFKCKICFSLLSKEDAENCLYAPCCKNNWFHRTCLQGYALSAGQYFFKCPMCNNSSDFIKEMQTYGINIPKKDASWELEENAYQELLHRPDCGADTCHSKNGRDFDGDSIWTLLACSVCGSHARHIRCENLKSSETSWKCIECITIENMIHKGKCSPQVDSENADKKEELVVPFSEKTDHSVESICQPSCSNSPSSSFISNFESIADIYNRALRCIVQVSPLKIRTESKAVAKSISVGNFESAKRKATSIPDLNSKKICLNDIQMHQISIKPLENDSAALNVKVNVKASPVKAIVKVEYPKSKMVSKKRKKGKKLGFGCCSGHSQQCIRRMFGLECSH